MTTDSDGTDTETKTKLSTALMVYERFSTGVKKMIPKLRKPRKIENIASSDSDSDAQGPVVCLPVLVVPQSQEEQENRRTGLGPVVVATLVDLSDEDSGAFSEPCLAGEIMLREQYSERKAKSDNEKDKEDALELLVRADVHVSALSDSAVSTAGSGFAETALVEESADKFIKVDSDASEDECWVVFEPELSTESSENEARVAGLVLGKPDDAPIEQDMMADEHDPSAPQGVREPETRKPRLTELDDLREQFSGAMARVDEATNRLRAAISVDIEDIQEKIHLLRLDNTVAFAHCISDDLGTPRHMSRGVAVVFANSFGKPCDRDRVGKKLTVQRGGMTSGAYVFGVITKPAYNAKPDKVSYGSAMQALALGIRARPDIKTLYVPPMGTMRDAMKYSDFTGALMTVAGLTGVKIQVCVWQPTGMTAHYQNALWDSNSGRKA